MPAPVKYIAKCGLPLMLLLSSTILLEGSGDRGKQKAQWYPLREGSEGWSVLDNFIKRKLDPYKVGGISADSVKKSLSLSACSGCNAMESKWNSHFQIINSTVYVVGGMPLFWNEHHRKRVKSVFALLSELATQSPPLPDVEFVVNFHDYNKLLRPPGASDAWGDAEHAPPFDKFRLEGNSSNSTTIQGTSPVPKAGDEREAGAFKEHAPEYDGHDWELHYRIYGNHFGNPTVHADANGNPGVALFSATSCAFSYDISFPTTFYDFPGVDDEWSTLHSATEERFPWDDKKESAYFRGSCWYYKRHGRTAALAMSKVAKDMVDAAWYQEIRTDMLEKDGVPQFGEIEEAGRHKYLLHLEGHDYWSMRIRSLVKIRSLLLKQQLPCEEFYYGFFKPYVHYLPLQRDLGDAFEAVLWARENDSHAKAMADAMVDRASEVMSRKAVLQYAHMLITRYSALLNYKPTLSAKAEAIDPKSPCLSTLLPCLNGTPFSL